MLRSRRSAGVKLPLLLGAVLLLAGGGLAIFHFGGGEKPAAPVAVVDAHPAPAESKAPKATAPKKVDLSWLPPRADGILHIRPADLLKTEFAQWVIDAANGRKAFDDAQEFLRKEIGVALAEVESITLGFNANEETNAGGANLALKGMPDPMQAFGDLSKLRNQEFSVFIRLTKPIDLASITKLGEETELVSYNDAKYYRQKANDGKPGEECLYSPAPNVVVICGRENLLKSLIDGQGKSAPRAELDFIDPEQHFSAAFAPQAFSTAGPPANEASEDDPLAKFKPVQGLLLSIKASADLTLTFSQSCPDSKIAQEITTATDEVIAKMKEMFASVREILPENVAELADTLFAGMKTAQRGRLVATVMTLPATSRENLKAAPLELWQMYLTRMGFPGPGQNQTPADVTSLPGDGPSAPGSVKQVAGLPEGMTLEGIARWADADSLDDKDPLPPHLEIEIKCLGGPADKAIQSGHLRVTKIVAEPAQSFKVAERSAGDAEYYRGFVDLERLRFDGLSAKYGAGVRIRLEHPSLPISKFTLLEGEVTLRCVTETKEILVPNVLDQSGKPTNDPHLKAAGFAIAVTKPDESTFLRIQFANKADVAEIQLVDSKGDPLKKGPFLNNMGAGKELELASAFDPATLPQGVALRVKLRTKIDDVKVPFRLENLPIPAPSSETKAPVVGWRRAVATDAIPENFNVYGRLHWIEKSDFDDDLKLQKTKAVALQVDVTGPRALQIVAVGFQKVDKTETKLEEKLTFNPDGGLLGGDPSQQFVPRQADPFLNEEPPDGVRATLVLEPTPPPGSKIDRVAGSLKVLQAPDRKTVIVDKLATRIGANLSNAELEAAGLEAKLTLENRSLTLRIIKGHPYSLDSVKVIRENPISDSLFSENSTWSYDPAEKAGQLQLRTDKLTDADSLEVTFFTGLSEAVVPFEFEDLIVPPPKKSDDDDDE